MAEFDKTKYYVQVSANTIHGPYKTKKHADEVADWAVSKVGYAKSDVKVIEPEVVKPKPAPAPAPEPIKPAEGEKKV